MAGEAPNESEGRFKTEAADWDEYRAQLSIAWVGKRPNEPVIATDEEIESRVMKLEETTTDTCLKMFRCADVCMLCVCVVM